MGSCVSAHKSSQSAMDLKMSMEPKTDAVSVGSQSKDGSAVNNPKYPGAEIGFKPHSVLPVASFQSLSGSKDDIFFDSQACLDSDCDDFVSVNGDLTPSHGNSPVDGQSPTDKKKRLLELFHEGVGDDPIDGNKDSQDSVKAISSADSVEESPCTSVPDSGCISERTPNRRTRTEKGNMERSTHCCLPGVVRSLSVGEWRRKKSSPAHSGKG